MECGLEIFLSSAFSNGNAATDGIPKKILYSVGHSSIHFLGMYFPLSASFCKLCNAPVWQRHLAKLASGGEQDGATAQRKDQVESLDAIGLLSWRQIQQWKQSE